MIKDRKQTLEKGIRFLNNFYKSGKIKSINWTTSDEGYVVCELPSGKETTRQFKIDGDIVYCCGHRRNQFFQESVMEGTKADFEKLNPGRTLVFRDEFYK
jgi:hypothetical protein